MNRICWTILALVALLIGRADAQVAPQAVIGYQSTSCGTGPSPCFIPYGNSATYFVQPGASDNHANIKNSAGAVYFVIAQNNSATVNYLRLYNAAAGFNACNSATNLITQIQIPGSVTVGSVVISYGVTGIRFSTGIAICVTSGYATNDATNATASAMSVTVGYN